MDCKRIVSEWFNGYTSLRRLYDYEFPEHHYINCSRTINRTELSLTNTIHTTFYFSYYSSKAHKFFTVAVYYKDTILLQIIAQKFSWRPKILNIWCLLTKTDTREHFQSISLILFLWESLKLWPMKFTLTIWVYPRNHKWWSKFYPLNSACLKKVLAGVFTENSRGFEIQG